MNPADADRPSEPLERKRPKLAPLSKLTKSDTPAIDLRRELPQADPLSQSVSKAFSQDLSDQNLQVHSVLGKGSQATVYLATYLPTNTKVALKKVFIQDKTELLCLQRELLSLTFSVHPNILRCFGARVSPEHILISLEYMDWGTLKYFIENEPGGIPELVVSIVVYQVLKALAYLHKEKKTIHRDIKPSNLLLNSQGEVKLADFGIARQVGGTEGQANTFLGTLLYMSPERINGKDYQMNCDIWALGMVAYECALGRYPGLPDPRRATLLDLRRLFTEGELRQFPSHFSDKLKSFLTCCLQTEPEKRARATDLLEHPFVRQGAKIARDSFREWLETVVLKALHCQKKDKTVKKPVPS